jgi:hypothetical protein
MQEGGCLMNLVEVEEEEDGLADWDRKVGVFDRIESSL